MAITFTEVFRSNVLDSLTTLLNGEFNKLQIFQYGIVVYLGKSSHARTAHSKVISVTW